MGAPRRWDLELTDPHWAEPLEDPEVDGCPGGWYRTAFVESVLRYRRRPCEGGRIPNRLLDTCDDELVAEAVEWMEQCEDAWRNELLAARMDKMRADSARD